MPQVERIPERQRDLHPEQNSFQDELNEYASLCAEKSDLEMKLRNVKQKIADRESGLLEKMTDAGFKSVKTANGTIYINQRIWAKYPSKEEAVAILKKKGLTDMISETFNHISLSSYVAELHKEGVDVSAHFEGVIEANPTYQLLRRK